jgi:cytidine deaminase
MSSAPRPHPSGLSSQQIAHLCTLAAQAAANSYSPYSHFRVGAALLLEDGSHVLGCNVENASYRLTTCAEQTAIATAVATHGPRIRIRALAVANLNNAFSMPCGACRQTILEFASPQTYIFYPEPNGGTAEATLADLLPAAFEAKHLTPAS